MGLRRPRTLLLGLVAVLVALGSQQVAGSAPVATRVVQGGITATAPVSGDGWRVAHVDTGVYRITIPADGVDLDVPEWDQAADVTVVPLGRTVVEIRFARDGAPVDSHFSFVALVTD